MFRSLLSLWVLLSMGATTAPTAPDFDPLTLLTVEPIPSKSALAIEPVIEAGAALLMDADSGLMLYQKNVHAPMPMASLTKIMTALLILENHDLDEVVTVEEDFSTYPELGVRMFLFQYEKLTVENLLKGLLVRSAGDAAMALAIYHSGSVEAFVDEMNERSRTLSLRNTRFQNPIGLDAPEQYSTAFDLAILTKHALKNADFRRIVAMPVAHITSLNSSVTRSLDSTNYLLNSFLDIRGVKTGTTEGAGESLINLAVKPNGREVIAVILRSPERFQESKRLIEWSFRNYLW